MPSRIFENARVIVIRQPWAWLIVHGYKDIENRTWPTHHRGPLLIQASGTLPSKKAMEDIRQWVKKRGVKLPESFDTGGIVGMAQIEDCVAKSRSKWFEGPVGWVLSNPRRIRFFPTKGKLGLYSLAPEVLEQLRVLR